MARWAFWMLISTGIMAVVTGAGVYYVWQSLKVTTDIGRAQTLAYVEVSDVRFYWGTPEGTRPEFKIVLTNHGATAAQWFQVRQAFSTFKHGDADQTIDAKTMSEVLKLIDEALRYRR